MRILSALIIFVLFLATSASAELLVTANPLGKGRIALQANGVQEQDWGNNDGVSLTSYGISVGYGLTDVIDLYIQGGASNSSTITTEIIPGSGINANTDITATGYGALAKLNLVREGEKFPVSVAVGAGYRAVFSTAKTGEIVTPFGTIPASESDLSGSSIVLATGFSKIIVPFVPYLGLVYSFNSLDNVEDSTQADVTLGTLIAWSENGGVFVEYTFQSIAPPRAPDYTNNQMAVSVSVRI